MTMILEEYIQVNGLLARTWNVRELGCQSMRIAWRRFLEGSCVLTQGEGGDWQNLITVARMNFQVGFNPVWEFNVSGAWVNLNCAAGTLKDCWVSLYDTPRTPNGYVPMDDSEFLAVGIGGDTGQFNMGGGGGLIQGIDVWVYCTDTADVRLRCRFADQWPIEAVGQAVAAGVLTRVATGLRCHSIDCRVFNTGAGPNDIRVAAVGRLAW